MSSPNWKRVQGDNGDTLLARLDGVADLAGVTAVEAHVRNPRSNDAATTLPAVVTDAAARTVTVTLSPWLDDADPAVWQLEVQAKWGTSATKTWTGGTIDLRGQIA